MKLVGLSGSLRKDSFNTALMRAAARLVPADVTFVEATIHGIPLYDGDLEAEQGLPEAVVALKDQIATSDGLMLFTPEYNNSIPGPFKNAIDWLSRPSTDIARVFGGRPVALLGTTPGGFGTVLSQTAWLPILRTLGTAPWFGPRMLVAHAAKVFDADGSLTDPDVSDRLAAFMIGFVDHIRRD